MSEPFIGMIVMFAGNFAPAVGPFVTVKFYQLPKTLRSFQFWEPRMAVTAKQHLRFPIYAAECRCIRVRARDCRLIASARRVAPNDALNINQCTCPRTHVPAAGQRWGKLVPAEVLITRCPAKGGFTTPLLTLAMKGANALLRRGANLSPIIQPPICA